MRMTDRHDDVSPSSTVMPRDPASSMVNVPSLMECTRH